MTISPAVRSALQGVDPQVAVDQVGTVERLQAEFITARRVITILLGIFAALALVISACGIAAVMALSVRQRTQELGIRMALGAAPVSIVRMVVRQGLMLAVAGTVLGIGCAIALTRLLSTLLYDTSPTDVFTFVPGVVVFFLNRGAGCFFLSREGQANASLVCLAAGGGCSPGGEGRAACPEDCW